LESRRGRGGKKISGKVVEAIGPKDSPGIGNKGKKKGGDRAPIKGRDREAKQGKRVKEESEYSLYKKEKGGVNLNLLWRIPKVASSELTSSLGSKVGWGET